MTLIPEDRPLMPNEVSLVRWLLDHGTAEAVRFIPQLSRTRVVSRCPCGCASIDFAIDGRIPAPASKIEVLSDYAWQDARGYRFGVFVFAKDEILAGLDLWSIDGLATASALPEIEDLQPLVQGWGAEQDAQVDRGRG